MKRTIWEDQSWLMCPATTKLESLILGFYVQKNSTSIYTYCQHAFLPLFSGYCVSDARRESLHGQSGGVCMMHTLYKHARTHRNHFVQSLWHNLTQGKLVIGYRSTIHADERRHDTCSDPRYNFATVLRLLAQHRSIRSNIYPISQYCI
jgi:hypothetical protein